MHFFRCLAIATLTLTASCRVPVAYELRNDGRRVSQMLPVSVRVAEFKDQAPKHPSVNLTIGHERWKSNALDVYKNKEYIKGINQMMTADLASSGLFRSVVGHDSAAPAQYELRGTVWDFSGMGKWRLAPENSVLISSVLASFPGTLIAAACVSQFKTDVVTSVILTDLKLVDLKTGKTVWKCGPLRAGKEQRVGWSKADAKPLVKTVNEDLRDVVTQLINRMNKELKLPARS